ncbi:unnamed protein product, partial [Brassica oleracea]
MLPGDNATPHKGKLSATDTDHGEHKIKARWILTKVKVEDHV